jgi:hypothetical protein
MARDGFLERILAIGTVRAIAKPSRGRRNPIFGKVGIENDDRCGRIFRRVAGQGPHVDRHRLQAPRRSACGCLGGRGKVGGECRSDHRRSRARACVNSAQHQRVGTGRSRGRACAPTRRPEESRRACRYRGRFLPSRADFSQAMMRLVVSSSRLEWEIKIRVMARAHRFNATLVCDLRAPLLKFGLTTPP